jgi:trigger factor
MFRISNLALVVCLALSNNNASAFTSPSFGVKTSTAAVNSSPAFIVAPPVVAAVTTTSLRMSEDGASKLVRKPESSVELTITAPGAATKAAYDKACAEVSKTISIPGFRKGAKIPPAVIENAMAAKGGRNTLKTQAIQSLLNQLLEPALKEEHNLEPVGQPSLTTSADELADSFVPGEPIEMTVACDVWPDISWKEVEGQEKPYFGLSGSYKRKPFNDARFQQAEKDLAERYAVTEPAPEGTELAMGDSCVVNMDGFMAAEDGVTKADPLPNAASGDKVDVVLGEGRYMEGLVEGLVGAKVGETKQIYVTFPEGLRDKTLAGKKAIFDVNVLEANTRTVPEIDDELAGKIRPGLDAEGVRDELRKAIDENESADWIEARNKVLSSALAEVMDVDVPDTLVTTQAREKYAQMMSEFRGQGMADDEIKKLITPENFQVYKDIEKPDIVKDFKTSMATDEIARLESIEVPAYQIDEQLEAVKKEANGEDLGDENMIRNKIESTLMRRMVFDFLAEKADLSVEYTEEEEFDEAMMEELMQQTMKDKEGKAEDGKLVDDGADTEDIEAKAAADAKAKEETEIAEATTAAQTHEAEVAEAREQPTSAEEEKKLQERYASMDLEERAFNILVDLGSVELTPDPESPTYDNSEDSEFVQ